MCPPGVKLAIAPPPTGGGGGAVLGQGNMPKFVTQLCNPEMSLYILGTPPFSNNPNNNRSLPVGLQHETFLAKTITSV
uniref:Uncharacterized protein n=1 Tax=Solanum lycopersicum TaxID=4081 RepID=A0A3Q7ISY1_SOLLC